jgi:hypothetical protein
LTRQWGLSEGKMTYKATLSIIKYSVTTEDEKFTITRLFSNSDKIMSWVKDEMKTFNYEFNGLIVEPLKKRGEL